MKALHLFPVHDVGGAEAVLLNLMRFRIRPDLAHQAIIISDQDGELGNQLSDIGVPWTRIPRGRMRNPRDLWLVRSALRREIVARRPDVLIANSSQGFLYGSLAATGLGVPGVLYQMSVPDTRWWRNGPLDWMTAARQPDLVIAASNLIRERVRAWSRREVVTIYHGAPVPRTDSEGEALAQHELMSRGVSPTSPVVLMPGRLQRWKGQAVFVEAFASVLAACPDAHAVCLGSALFGLEPDFPAVLAAMVHARGLEGRIHLVPHQPVGPWLQRSAVVVHASLVNDAFPIVCIEAMASGRALVTNALAGTSEVVRDGIDASVVPAGDPGALSSAIAALLQNSQRRERMAEAGRQRYLAMCTPAHMVAAIESALTGAPAGRNAA